MNDLLQIIAHFSIEGKVEKVRPLGNGLINDTFLITTKGNIPDYILQRINHHIFKMWKACSIISKL